MNDLDHLTTDSNGNAKCLVCGDEVLHGLVIHAGGFFHSHCLEAAMVLSSQYAEGSCHAG